VSLIPANIEYLGFAIQSAKGTPASAPKICVALEDCSLEPNPTVIQTAESDSSSQQGEKVIVGAQPGGTFKKYVRPSEEDFFLYCLLGKNVDSGTTPKVHTANVDPAAPFTTPYITVWDVWPGVASVRYDDCRIAQAKIDVQPGQAASVEYTLVALKATLGVTEPTPTGLFASELPHTWAELAVSLGGVHGGIANQASLTIDRNTGRFEGDNGLDSLDCPNGLFAVSGELEVAFQDDDLLRAANTGTTDGTVLTTTLYDQSVVLDFTRGANLETKFTVANAQISDYKVGLKTDASPAIASFNFSSKRQADVATVISTVVKNAIAAAARP
jgi:hypothetical protein